ncbi:MAG: glycosyltransferase [Fusobacteriaceae bacterium]|jgi:glycosyltransferase involved in cell wall biosynthesis|nr:glycosyltransferase [Fusobacteriaceae bacterium]
MKLSIITVNLNNREGLQKTIDSVVSQTFTDYEYIIIDGGSTDGSVDIIKQYEDKITYWVSEQDKGIYNAMNKGIMQAKGEYCLFLNSGDWLYNDNILNDLFSLDFNEDIIYGNEIDIYPDGTLKEVKFNRKISFGFLFINYLPHQASFFKRILFDKVGFYSENYKYNSDQEFYFKAIFKYECSFIHIDIYITYYDRSGISSNKENHDELMRERDTVVKQIFPLLYDDYIELRNFKNIYDYKAYIVGKIALYPFRIIWKLCKKMIKLCIK